jgi:hypothetical protein
MEIGLRHDGREDFVFTDKSREDNRIYEGGVIREDDERNIRLEVFNSRDSDPISSS